MIRSRLLACCAMAAVAAWGTQAQAATVTVGDSTGGWQGYMNVFQLPADGGAYVFGSGWGIPDLVADFDDANSMLTLAPNTINDASSDWYQDTCNCAPDPANPGGTGQAGNRIMEANLYVETTDVYNGQTLTFEGNVLSNSLTADHVAQIFIRDFAPDYSSFVDSSIPVVPGPFSVSLATDPAGGRHVQYGFQVVGPNVWATDVGPFGSAVIGTVPEPTSIALVGLCGLALIARRRNR